MPQQTAVEWLALIYHQRHGYLSLEDIAKAKEMEKKQMQSIYKNGIGDTLLTQTIIKNNQT